MFDGPIVQAWIPIALAAGSMLMGAYQGKRKEDQAKAQDQLNANMMSLDTAYSPFVASQGYKAT